MQRERENRPRDPWLEERVEAVRLALHVSAFPEYGDLTRLFSLAGPLPGRETPQDLNQRLTRAEAVLRTLRDAPLDRERCALLGQTLWSVGLGYLTLPQGGVLQPGLPTGAALERAAQFFLAWALPSRWVQRLPDDAELAWQSNCTRELVGERRQGLAGTCLLSERPPEWSAFQRYHAVAHMAASRPVLDVYLRRGAVRRPTGGLEPAFRVLAARHTIEALTLRVGADLTLMTVPEFERAYGGFRVPPAALARDTRGRMDPAPARLSR